MAEQNDSFTPKDVEQQLQRVNDLRRPSSENARLVRDLKQIMPYYQETDEDDASLQAVWQRVTSTQDTSSSHKHKRLFIMQKTVRQKQNTDTFARRSPSHLGVLAAVIFIALLVGSMAYVFSITRNAQNTRTGSGPVGQGATIYTRPGQDASIQALAWSNDGKSILSYNDRTLQTWDATTGANVVDYGKIFQTAEPGKNIQAIRWSPNNKYIALASDAIYLLDTQTKRISGKFQYSGGQQAAVQGQALSFSISTPGLGKQSITTLRSRVETRTLAAHVPNSGGGAFFSNVIWSPDGNFIAASYDPTGTASTYAILVWNVQSGKVQTTFTGHKRVITALTWSPDGKHIASAEYDNIVKVWDVQNGIIAYTQNVPFNKQFEGDQGITSLVWSPDGQRLATANHTGIVALWYAMSGKDLKTVQFADKNTSPNSAYRGVSSLAWSPDGKRVAVAGYGVHLIDAASASTLFTYTAHRMYITVVAWSPDGKYLVSGEGSSTSADMFPNYKDYGAVKVWQAR